MTVPRLLCTGLTRRLPSGSEILTILDHVDLRIDAGEFVAILGPSGSGKSTLLGLLAGLDRPSDGSVQLDGQPLETLDEDALALLRREKVGFVFQNFQLLENLTARENILLPMELGGMSGATARADDLLQRVGLGKRGHHYPAQLSGGEQQRIALARAFGPSPGLLLADEPTGNLDSETGRAALDLLVGMQEAEGTTLVLVTHDHQVAERARRRVHIEGGRIVKDTGSSEPVPGPGDAVGSGT